MIPRIVAFDMIAQRDRELISEPMQSQDATDSSENADPMLSTEPTDPMLRIDPAEPMLAIDSKELRDAYESVESARELRLAMQPRYRSGCRVRNAAVRQLNDRDDANAPYEPG